MTQPDVKEAAPEQAQPAEQPEPAPESDETEIKCTLCGLRACWTSS
jgi:hypothetical protein